MQAHPGPLPKGQSGVLKQLPLSAGRPPYQEVPKTRRSNRSVRGGSIPKGPYSSHSPKEQPPSSTTRYDLAWAAAEFRPLILVARSRADSGVQVTSGDKDQA